MKTSRLLLSSLLMSSVLVLPAFAQTAVNDKIDRMERDLQLIQRQLSRGEVTPGSGGGDLGAAQLEVRISAIEDEMRNLRGKTEENEFQLRRANENLEKLQRDVDLRFADLANRQPAPAVSPMAAEPATAPKDGKEAVPSPAGSEAGADKSEDDPAPNANGEFATPREHYNYAFRLLNQTKYKEAADSFAQFTKKHPKDALVGNAYYWQGETHYIRRDYGNAADMFRQGFEAMPDGPKAADNLLKLAMSLSALKREKEACVVLEQLATKFTKSSKNIANRAVQEQKRIGCGA